MLKRLLRLMLIILEIMIMKIVWCDSKDIKYIEVGSYVNNKEAFNLYQKNGFEVVTYFMRKKV